MRLYEFKKFSVFFFHFSVSTTAHLILMKSDPNLHYQYAIIVMQHDKPGLLLINEISSFLLDNILCVNAICHRKCVLFFTNSNIFVINCVSWIIIFLFIIGFDRTLFGFHQSKCPVTNYVCCLKFCQG